MSKYRSVKTVVDGIVFDSRKEAFRYNALKLLVKAGEISDLELQPVFQVELNGRKICRYKADFRYTRSGETIVEDVKSAYTRTLPVYRLKKKLVEAQFGLKILET